jgi:isoquinoline 1-oxidoreductase subunit beta
MVNLAQKRCVCTGSLTIKESIMTKNISRRNFLKLSGMLGTGLCLGLNAAAGVINVAETDAPGFEMNPWMFIDTSGKVTLMSHRAEMGQGVYQSIPQILAEELEVNLDDVNIRFTPGDKEKYGNQITGGSSSIRTNYKRLLKLGATAREMLITAAATKWAVDRTTCYAEAGHIIHKPSGKKLHYGELIEVASKLKAPETVTLKSKSDYKLVRKPLKRQDTKLKVNGAAVFGLDKVVPGMLYAVVERNPRLRGKVKTFDASKALAVPGVKKVFKVRMGVFKMFREGVAIVADSTWAAMQAKKKLKVEWDDSGFEHLSSEEIYKRHETDLKTKEGLSFLNQGDANSVLKSAAKKLDVIYQTPYESHYCMEPLNCVAHYHNGKLDIWGPIQAPEWVREFVSKEMKIPMSDITVNMTFLGGGFGRKAFMDYPHEAALISKEMNAPVQVIWTREDDATQGPFRPGMSYRCEGVVANGEISAFKIKLSGQNMGHFQDDDRSKPNDSANEGFLKPYLKSIKHVAIQDVPFETPIPVMWWRSVYASTNGFAYESFIDELAIEAGKDPMAFRRQHLQEERCQRLIDKLEEVSGWKNRQPQGGMGVAITECFESTVGQVVKVSKQGNGVKVDKVWAVIDCGWYVNPDTIKAQVEGAIIMALGAATMHETTFKDGMAVQKNFYEYPMPRINEIPDIEVYIMENDADAGGVGEPGLPAFSPALTNAIYDLNGKRIRKLPFDLSTI